MGRRGISKTSRPRVGARWILILMAAMLMAVQIFLTTAVTEYHDVEQQGPTGRSSIISPHMRNKHLIGRKGQPLTDPRPLRTSKDDTHPKISAQSPFLYDQPLHLDDPAQFPPWVKDYVEWHAKMRQEFPGMELFTNPHAPNLLIRTCLGLCGGLHDRVGQLPWDLYLAQATNRVLLLAWQRPRSLEHFLVPNQPEVFDWRVPPEAQFGFDDMKHVRNFTQLFEGFPEDRPTDEFWNKHVDQSLERAISGPYKHVKVLRHRLLGHLGEAALEARLQKDFPEYPSPSYHQVHAAPYFGNFFWLFFRPSPAVHQQVRSILATLELTPHHYHAVHCRVRHPKATSSSVHIKGKNPKFPADKTGLPWEGDTKEFALEVASQALGCSLQLQKNSHTTGEETTPVYFLSDSNDLVRHVAVELQDPEYRRTQANWTDMDRHLSQVIQQAKPISEGRWGWIKARDVSEETAHLDKQKGRPPEAYYSTFVDLMLAIHAQCVVYGIGYYAAFAAKISGTSCQYLYQKESWGSQAAKAAKVCASE